MAPGTELCQLLREQIPEKKQQGHMSLQETLGQGDTGSTYSSSTLRRSPFWKLRSPACIAS